MPTIKVNTSQLGTLEGEMQGILSQVNSITSQFNSVYGNLDWDIRAEANINNRLAGISRKLEAEGRGINGMKNFLSNAIGKYNAVERLNSYVNWSEIVTDTHSSISMPSDIICDVIKTKAGENAKPIESYKVDWIGGTFKWISKVGLVGSTINTVYTFSHGVTESGYKQANAFVKTAKDLVGGFGKIAKNAYSESPNIRELAFGKLEPGGYAKEFAKYAEKTGKVNLSGRQAFWTDVKRNILDVDDYSFKNAKTVGDKINVTTKWAGEGLSLVSKVLDNLDEKEKHPEMSNARFVAEVATEFVADKAIDGLAKAAVGAGLAALGVAASPVVVAVGAAVVVWGADQAVKAYTSKHGEKKGLTEVVSDSVLDFVENPKGCVTSATDTVTRWASSVFDG